VFLSENETGRSDYVELYELSVEGIKAHEEDILRKVNSVVRGLRELGADCPAVTDRLNRIEKAAQSEYTHKLKLLEDLGQAYDQKRDAVFFFYSKSNTRQEFGWMVVNRGKIKKKVLLGEGVVLPTE
jgi:hypothetical protein